MSLGNPVVTTHVGAQGIEALNGEHLLLADEPTQFAEAVDRLLTQADTFGRIRRAARELVETRYDWCIIGNVMNQVIEDLLRQRKLERETHEVSGR
jgi:glycosyltransferase involved in cell wall biosynthesis